MPLNVCPDHLDGPPVRPGRGCPLCTAEREAQTKEDHRHRIPAHRPGEAELRGKR